MGQGKFLTLNKFSGVRGRRGLDKGKVVLADSLARGRRDHRTLAKCALFFQHSSGGAAGGWGCLRETEGSNRDLLGKQEPYFPVVGNSQVINVPTEVNSMLPVCAL